MQGPSRQTYADLRVALDVAVSEGGEATTLASELYSISDLLGGQGSLRRSLGDSSRSGADRAALLTKILGTQVSASASKLAAAVVSGRWTKPSDIVVAFDTLGDEALFADAESAGSLDAVEDELFRFARVVERESALASALSDPALPATQKSGLLQTLLEGKATPQTLALIERAVNGRRTVPVDRALVLLTEAAAARRSRTIATVTSAVELSPEQLERLKTTLSSTYGANMQVQVEVDPSLVGGLVVQVGDELIDGSVSRRLDTAARALTR